MKLSEIRIDKNGDEFVTPLEDVYPRYYIGCTLCDGERARGNTFFPAHLAMSHCRSGGYTHCTCDSCF